MSNFYTYLLEDEELQDQVSGEEIFEEEGDEESPFDQDDFEVTEAVIDEKEDKGSFRFTARKILRLQKKLGKIQSINLKLLSISEGRKRAMKKAGILSAAIITTSALIAAGIITSRKSTKAQNFIKNQKQKHPKLTKAIDNHSDKLQIAGLGAAGVASVAHANAWNDVEFSKHFKTVMVEVKYQYGSKLFEIWGVAPDEEQEGLHKELFNELKKAISYYKNKKDWKIKESATPVLLKNQQIAQALTEAYLFNE